MINNPINPVAAGEFDQHFITRDARLNMPHTTGHRIDPSLRLSAVDAFREAGLMWNTQKVEAAVQFGDQRVGTGQYMLFKTPTDGSTPTFLGMVSDKYVPISNAQLAFYLNTVSAEYAVEGAGWIESQKAVIIAFSGMQWDVRVAPRKRDELQDRLFVTNYFTAGSALAAQWTSQAFWCTNQLNWIVSRVNRAELGSGAPRLGSGRYSNGQSTREGVLRIHHNADAHKALEYVTERLAQAARGEPERREYMQFMANHHLKTHQINAVLDAAFPLPARAQLTNTINAANNLAAIEPDAEARALVARTEDNTDQRRETNVRLRELVFMSLDARGIGGSAYAVMNAIIEVLQWRQNMRTENVGFDLLAGDRRAIVDRAANKIREYID